jgi:hypothetical protein
MFSLLFRISLLLILLAFSQTAQALKTDVVYLNNGDRVTGEIKNLHHSKLEFSTDHMGTVYIEWEDIDQIISNTGQSVELTNGQRFYGPLAKAESQDMMAIATDAGTVGISTLVVIGMYPVEAGFWDRLDLSASLGFTWDKASEVGKYNLGIEAEYRNPRFITRFDLSTEMTSQEGRDDTTRGSMNLSHIVFRKNKRYHQVFGGFENSDELGIDLRTMLGAGYGWVPIRSQRNWLSIGGGLAVNHELPLEGESETNLEAVGSFTYDFYRYSSPERRFRVNLLVFPSLTDLGRYRVTFDTNYRFELVSDLFWDLDFYSSYDSDPVSEDASHSDYGVTSSLGYKF